MASRTGTVAMPPTRQSPPIVPLVGASRASDVLVVHLIPTDHAGLPMTKSEIDKRLGQITFNGLLQKELEAVAMMKQLVRKEGEPVSDHHDACLEHPVDPA